MLMVVLVMPGIARRIQMTCSNVSVIVKILSNTSTGVIVLIVVQNLISPVNALSQAAFQ